MDAFVKNIGKKLIENKSFIITNTDSLPALITHYSFVKDMWGALHVINFVNADMLDFSNDSALKSYFLEELKAFKSVFNAGALVYFKVFVTQYGLSPETLAKLSSFHEHSIVTRSSFIPVVVDLSTGLVILNNDEGVDKIGLKKIVEENLNADGEVPDLLAVQNSMEQRSGLKYIKGENFKSRVTYTLIIVNIIIFVLMEILGGSTNSAVLTAFGMKLNSLIVRGQYWRLVTAAFLHIGLPHMIFNMYGLYNLGSLVEKIYGSKKYLLIYMCAALLGNISSFIFSPYPSAGASGAIFGLFGAILNLGRKNPKLFSTSFGVNILLVLGFNLIYGFSSSGIDNFAHIGGLVGGYISSSIWGLKDK